MKQVIMEKLFDGKELSNEEILFIGKNLTGCENPVTFNHGNENTIAACGISKEDITKINSDMSKLTRGITSLSEAVELVEMKAVSDEKILRAVIINSLHRDSISEPAGQDIIRQLIEKIIKKGGKNEENSD